MPRLWEDTIEAHRREVRDAILDTTAQLVAEHGLLSVTMTQIAGDTGIGRATLYKYFPDADAILVAWHERQVGRHLTDLSDVKDRTDDPHRQLRAVLEAHALMTYDHHDSVMPGLAHHGEHVADAQQRLHAFITGILHEAADSGLVRDDVDASELATYTLHALAAAAALPSKAAVKRLVDTTLDGLRPSN